ncbi:hypothetical protein K469DRAFT_722292 [Zopfia rhizophila CBS 207.26]|uniref:Uncharacterized protein n=1 Tax=Zopfia rhizophila CBS 207.26 TaxID=1314779 RepID=A0A6A6DAB6_9PEZI|nr:hypothetical protein K469DRAFT_722292 [Zopfia rhizophila CBS 207.26]
MSSQATLNSFGISARSQPDRLFILAPPHINPLANNQPKFDECTYRGKAYIRYKHLTKTPAQIRRRKSSIW